jgi:FkbM family methyltransferase
MTTDILGSPLMLVDGLSFSYSYHEIVQRRIYDFETTSQHPRIIDGGANIGLAVLFFKHRYPTSRVIVFEADAAIFQVLQTNIRAFKCEGVSLVNKALWSKDSKVTFLREGADAGRLALEKEAVGDRTVQVDAIRLAPYLECGITDFLKLDIEGAEYEVLSDCAASLINVRNIFLEYHSFAHKPQRLDEILRILRETGFRVQIHTQFASQQPLLRTETQCQMDLQLNIFGRRS